MPLLGPKHPLPCGNALYLHGPELGSKGTPDAAGENDGRDDRDELPGEGEGQHAADAPGEAQLGKLPSKLEAWGGDGHDGRVRSRW